MTHLRGTSVLVLEDDRDTLELFGASLSKLGADVRCASSADAALAILATWRPHAILCDLHLPGVDGYGFLERVRALPHLRDIPVIAVSASHPELERGRAVHAGFDRHVAKPARLAEIVAAVASVVALGAAPPLPPPLA